MWIGTTEGQNILGIITSTIPHPKHALMLLQGRHSSEYLKARFRI